MSDECRVCLLGLIFLSSLLTGISGVDETHVFISSGENVRLSCNNALHDCNSTTWNYNGFIDSATVELIGLGIKKKDTERHERLSLGSDCSLNIRNISKEDYGYYTCQQYLNGQRLKADARVFLHVLHVSSSQTEISAGLSVTLFCQLYSYPPVSCDDWIRSERIQLFWVNQTGVKLTRSDSRYQILSSSDHCIITLNTTLLNEDHNREWRCEVTQRDQVKTSVTYTVKSSAQSDSTTSVIPVHNTHSQDPSTTNTHTTKGISGVDETHVFISSGENVRLSCNNALHDCTSTTWNYNGFRDSATVELIGLGIKKKDTERHERLSLGSDCSLNIRNISTEDYGLYSCQQWTGVNRDKHQKPNARVYLHVLHVSSSQTEISAGLSVTLFCQLYSYPPVSCDDWIGSERIQLFWVNQAGVKLTRSDSRYQISSSSDHCIITLNTTLLNEDHNREWRCEVTQRDQVKTSVTYTVKSSAPDSTLIRVSSSNSETTSSRTTAAAPTQATAVIQDNASDSKTKVIVIVIVVCASFVLLLLALILWMMIRKKRSGVRRATDDSVDPSSRAGTNSLFCESNLESLHSSPESRQTSPSQAEQTDDVTYTEVTAFSKNRAKKNKVHCDDKVTYASIGGAKAGALEDYSQLYASVN
uniref:Ig-like domain-containing protein n=1 Tax=Cyprinus carpio carpio TaxID=630221 RepID=A0A8C1E947_CYPCA